MTLAALVYAMVVVAVVGVCIYLLEHYVPMSEPIKVVLRVVVVISLVLYLLSTFSVVNLKLS